MAKDTFYFSHDYNVRMDIKIKKLIQKHGMVGYGIFWAIIEDLYNNGNMLPTDYECISFDLRTDENIVKNIINDFDLFIVEDEYFYSNSVSDRLKIKDSKSDIGRKNAQARWDKNDNKNNYNANKNDLQCNCNATAMQEECNPNAIKESKVKENKLNESKVNLQNKCKEKIEKYEETFFEEDLQNFIDHFKPANITEQEIREAIHDFKLNKVTSENPEAPFNYKIYKEWTKKYITENREKYVHIPKMRIVSISEDATREDLHTAFKFYWMDEYTIEEIRERILSGEYKPKDGVPFDNLIKNKLIEVRND